MTSRPKLRDENLPTCPANARARRVAMSDADIMEALENSGGIYKSAAAWLAENKDIHVTREAVRLRVVDNEDLLKIKNSARHEITDIAQTNIVKAIKNGETRESEWWLTNSPEGKAAGFGSKTENVISNPEGSAFKVEDQTISALPAAARIAIANIIDEYRNTDTPAT